MKPGIFYFNMKHAISLLTKQKELLDSNIKRDRGSVAADIEKKLEVEEALRWLTELQRHDLKWKTSRVKRLNCGQHGYSDVRLLIDNEIDNRNWWTEITLDEHDNNLKLQDGDILILRHT